jgi:hypothetical protein
VAKFIVKELGEFPWDMNTLSLRDALEMEKATKTRVADLITDYNGYNDPSGRRQKGMLGLTAFLWHAMRKNGHIVSYERMLEETDIGDVTEDFSDEETEESTPDPQPERPAKRQRSGSAQSKASSPKKSASTEVSSG